MVAPEVTLVELGVTWMEMTFASRTVTVVEPVMFACAAFKVDVPEVSPLSEPDWLIEATPAVLKLHATEPVMFLTLPSLKVPVAVICTLWPMGTDGVTGVIVMVVSVGFTKNPVPPTDNPNNKVTATAVATWNLLLAGLIRKNAS